GLSRNRTREFGLGARKGSRRRSNVKPAMFPGMRWLAIAAAVSALSCEVGQGVGNVRGNLKVECEGNDLSDYDMNPDFFGAIAANDQLLIRIQRGGDLQEYTDSLAIVVDDRNRVQDDVPITLALPRPAGSPP